MKNLVDLEKKVNSELTTKIKSSKIKHNQLYLNIDPDDLLEVILFLKTNSVPGTGTWTSTPSTLEARKSLKVKGEGKIFVSSKFR